MDAIRRTIGLSLRRAVTAAVYWSCRAAELLRRAGAAVQNAAGGLGSAVLTPEEQRALSARLYDARPQSSERHFHWERTWLKRDLPKPPARVLVGGCGRGREVGPLLTQGYEVWAFDPSLASVRECERNHPGAKFFGWFDYEQLVKSFNGPAERRVLPADVRFDAVLLGWGSLTHVVSEPDQEELLQLLDRLAPAGPILASFYLASSLPSLTESRAARQGLRVGRALGGRATTSADRVRLLPHAGFAYYFDEPRLQVLAAACGRRLALSLDGFPHTTFWPAGNQL